MAALVNIYQLLFNTQATAQLILSRVLYYTMSTMIKNNVSVLFTTRGVGQLEWPIPV